MPKLKLQSTGVSARVPAQLRDKHGLIWDIVQAELERQAMCAWVPHRELMLQSPPTSLASMPPWMFLETSFAYAPHRVRKRLGDDAGTQYPVLLLFAPGTEALEQMGDFLPAFKEWLLSCEPGFAMSRLLILAWHIKRPPAKSQEDVLSTSASCLVGHSVGVVEVADAVGAAKYVAQCVASVVESQRRRLPSRFKVAGPRCQTLSDSDAIQKAWVSQLMQIPGVSEEAAKAVAQRHPSPAALMHAIKEECSHEPYSLQPASDSFLASLELPSRGRNDVRRLGVSLSKRICAVFQEAALPSHQLT
mmetsp:Transcript_56098/g.126191  ORF Transcript_56098/g.126191 Transcript_56098/m.126191 type:complete len:304 (-) Transcript_56098:36-947(-)